MRKIVCSYDTFEKYCEVFDKMFYKAEDYVPTIEEIRKNIVPDLEHYILFLLWIDSTGKETIKNAKTRRLIRQIINNNFEVIDDDVRLRQIQDGAAV